MENQNDDKRSRDRSPAYPAIDLETAIERARQIKVPEGRRFCRIESILTYWKYASKSGIVMGALSALIKFGLLETKGSGADRQFKITDLAWNILIDPREDAPERDAAIREAALNPVIHRKLWDKYEGHLPPDVSLRLDLLKEENFSESGVNDFISEFKRTISFAKLEESDTLTRHEEDKSSFLKDAMEEFMPFPKPTESSPPSSGRGPNTSELPAQEFKLALSEGQFAYIKVPHSLKESDWEKIDGLLKILKPN